MNDIHIQKEFDNLNRNSKFSITEVDKDEERNNLIDNILIHYHHRQNGY